MIGFLKIFSEILIAILVCLNFQLSAQIILVNNPSNNAVAFNPAFSAIYTPFNLNYLPKSICISTRITKNQFDILSTGQYFFFKRNIGISGSHNYFNQSGTSIQKFNLGLSYQLVFFDNVSTGWGVALNNTNLNTDSTKYFSVYNVTENYTLKNSTYTTLTFGNIINYNQLLFGFSIQPKGLIFFNIKGSYFTSGSAQLKYKHTLTRNLNLTIWYNGNWNSINNVYLLSETYKKNKFQSHTLNFQISGSKRYLAGLGLRVSDFNYTSLIAKVGYTNRKIQFLYGAEPYFIGTKYSEIIHELSMMLKFD